MHTKGKWTVTTYHDKGSYFIPEVEESINKIYEEGDYDVECMEKAEEEMKANARLIAAAPKLLEACKSMERHFKYVINDEDDKVAYLKLKEAITNVEGGIK